MATGTTSNFDLSRNDVIETAFRKIGALRLNQVMSADKLAQGIRALNMIVREEDAKGTQQGKNLWALDEKTLKLQAAGYVYDVENDGLSGSILDMVSCFYRNTSGDDTEVKIVTAEQYDAIADKNDTGEVTRVYLKRDRDLACQLLYVNPVPNSVGTTSEIIGSDGINYRCTMGHTSDTINKPITGTSWRVYWSAGGTSGSAWVTATAYTNGELLRYVIKRPLYDFDNAGDNPDMPQGWGRYLVFRLAHDLSPEYSITLEERAWLKNEYMQARAEIFPNTQQIATDIYNKGLFY